MKSLIYGVAAVASLVLSSSAVAGEITGPPPTVNDPTGGTSISNGNSRCSFSGLNDTPFGAPELGDPGGIAQSYGYFQAHPGELELWHSSNPEDRADFFFPSQGCNPHRTGGRH